jgi:hypothetical protein
MAQRIGREQYGDRLTMGPQIAAPRPEVIEWRLRGHEAQKYQPARRVVPSSTKASSVDILPRSSNQACPEASIRTSSPRQSRRRCHAVVWTEKANASRIKGLAVVVKLRNCRLERECLRDAVVNLGISSSHVAVTSARGAVNKSARNGRMRPAGLRTFALIAASMRTPGARVLIPNGGTSTYGRYSRSKEQCDTG